jgi:hypothetical protein
VPSARESAESAMRPTAVHMTGRQRGEGRWPVGNSSGSRTPIRTNQTSPSGSLRAASVRIASGGSRSSS